MVEILKDTVEVDFNNELNSLKKEILDNTANHTNSKEQPDLGMVENFSFATDLEKDKSSSLFGTIAEQFNNKKSIAELNEQRFFFNKDNRSITPLLVDGKEIGRQRVTSIFDRNENGDLILKNYTAINNYQQVNEEKIYETLATIKPFVYENENTLRIESNDTYDYDILFHYDGHFSIIQKEGKKNKQPKLDTPKWMEDFSLFLKEVFPPAYEAYYDASKQATEKTN